MGVLGFIMYIFSKPTNEYVEKSKKLRNDLIKDIKEDNLLKKWHSKANITQNLGKKEWENYSKEN